jgi:glycosyltransferase involved in cell wall biosynthesis
LNLLLINPSGSPRPEVYGLAKSLPPKYEIIILQPSYGIEVRRDLYLRKNVCVRYIPTIFVPVLDSIVTIPIFQKWMRELLETVKLNKIDLIHVCDYEYLTSAIPIFAKQKHIPMVIVNDALIGVSYSFGTTFLDRLSRGYTYSIGKKILERYDRIVLLYSKLAEETMTLGLPKEKITVIPNGIDSKMIISYKNQTDKESLRRRYAINDEKVILYVGRLVKVKRVNIVLEVLQKLLNEGFSVKALIVGSGPQRAWLEKKFSSIRRNIVFTGFIPEKEKYACYSLASLFILPSISEGLPTVLLEAASMGLPIVASNVNGIPDIIIHGKTGFLVDMWCSDQYLEYTRELIMNEDLARRLGENARRHVENNFSWDVIAKKYQELYEGLFSLR